MSEPPTSFNPIVPSGARTTPPWSSVGPISTSWPNTESGTDASWPFERIVRLRSWSQMLDESGSLAWPAITTPRCPLTG